MLWLGICLPDLPLEVFASRDSPAHASALAVCDRLIVLQANPAARVLGIQPGIKRATAQALAAHLRLIERDPTLEHQALRQIACWALQFTPSVSLQPPAASALAGGCLPGSGLLLEVEPSLRLFGGLPALIGLIGQGLEQQGFGARIASAPTAAGAWMLARHRHGASAPDEPRLNARLAELPVELLEHATPHLQDLASMGIRTLRQLLGLPRAGLARRFGSEVLAELDRALGRRPDPRPWFDAPVSFDARLELLAQVENSQALLFAARRLILQLTGWLSARHAAVQRLELVIEHDGLEPTRLALDMATPNRDPDRITLLLREKLALTPLRAPTHTLGLTCPQVVALGHADASLFPMPENTREGFARLVERLQARLGREQVQRVLLASDHRPEAALRFEAMDPGAMMTRSGLKTASRTAPGSASRTAPGAASRTAPGAAARTAPGAASGRAPGGEDCHDAPPLPPPSLPRPLWLLPRPIPIIEQNNRPWWHGPLSLLAGPERIESGWWDGHLVRRDYFVASDASDMLLWIYRERLPDAHSRLGWFIHGRFG